MERRTERSGGLPPSRTGTVVDAKMSLALWLRAGRAQRGMSLEAVAKVTKIQGRILERLEAGKLDGLPADVFVRGFVRSFARCVGLDEAEAVRRYGQCVPGATISPAAPPTARAMVEAMADLAPRTAGPRILTFDEPITEIEELVSRTEIAEASEPGVLASGSLSDVPVLVPVFATPLPEIADALEAEPTTVAVSPGVQAAFAEAFAGADTDIAPKKKRKRAAKGRGGKRKAIATGTPSEPTPILEALEPIAAAPIEVIDSPTPVLEPIVDAPIEVVDAEPVPVTAPWSPTMPPVAPSVPWRRPHNTSLASVPSLVIDDADPDSAERVLEERAGAAHKERRSFLPPILLDREDRSARQGGLTLAVIILLVAATLTLSYLMRRPSAAGDGMTRNEVTPAQLHA